MLTNAYTKYITLKARIHQDSSSIKEHLLVKFPILAVLHPLDSTRCDNEQVHRESNQMWIIDSDQRDSEEGEGVEALAE